MGLTPDVVPNTPILSTWGNTIRNQTVMPFANAAERAAQWIAPPNGAISQLADTPRVLWIYHAGAWKRLTSDERPTGGEWYKTTQTTASAGVYTMLPLDGTAVDTDGFLVGGFPTIPAGLDGLYAITFVMTTGVGASWGSFAAGIQASAGSYPAGGQSLALDLISFPGSSTVFMTVPVAAVRLAAGTIVKPYFALGAPGTVQPQAAGNALLPRAPQLSLWRVGGMT